MMADVHLGHRRLVHRVVEQVLEGLDIGQRVELERPRPVEPVPRSGVGAEVALHGGLKGRLRIIIGFGPGQLYLGNAGVGTESK